MTYRVTVAGAVRRYIARLAPKLQERIISRIDDLAANPYDREVSKPLKGQLQDKRSSDLHDLRIIDEVDDEIRVLAEIDVGPRGDIYKR